MTIREQIHNSATHKTGVDPACPRCVSETPESIAERSTMKYTISFERDGVFVLDGTYTYAQMAEQDDDSMEFMKRLDAMQPGDVIRDEAVCALIEIRAVAL